MPKFSDRFLKSLKPKAARYEILEGDGFTVRVTPTGKKSFYYIFQLAGKNKRYRIGSYPATPLTTAREEHREMMARRSRGEEIRTKVELAVDVFTVKKLIEFYLKEWAEPRKRSWKEDERLLYKDIEPIWGKRPAATITRGEIITLLEATLPRGTTVSRDLLKVMRRMFNFAIERGRLEVNPCYLVKPLAKENVKDRYLTEKELRTFWAALPDAGISYDIQKILKLILITGQRPGEVAGIHAGEINGNWWVIPADRAKNGRESRIWLGDLALSLLPAGDDWLFPSGGIYDTIQTDTVAKALRRALTGKGPHNEMPPTIALAPFTPHDLRRTAATQMAASGITQHIIGQVLNHKEQTVTAIYNRYEYDDEKKQALLAWERRLLEIITPS